LEAQLISVSAWIYYSVANTRTINDNGFNPTFGADGEGETFDFDMQVCVSYLVIDLEG
jgi:hypothetical protein